MQRTPNALLFKTVSKSSNESMPPFFLICWKKASLPGEPTGSKTDRMQEQRREEKNENG